MVRLLVVAAFAALALGAAPTPAGNRAAARADAAALLGRLALPPGAVAANAEPAGDGGQLAQPVTRPATPNLVDRHGWWTVPGTPDAVIAYVRAHRPGGSRPVLSGSGVAGFQWPPRPGVLGMRWLVVQAVALAGGGTGVRADAEVVWISPRRRRERIPAGIDRLRVRGRTVSSPRRIRRVVHLLNGLPLAQPGASNCPAERSRARLAFYRGKTREAVALVDVGGCEDVALRLRGRWEPPLTGAAFPGSGRAGKPPLARQLERALGFRLSRGSAATPARSG